MASVAEPPLPSASSVPPPSQRRAHVARSRGERRARSRSASARAARRSPPTWRGPSGARRRRTASRSCSLLSEERVEEARSARVVDLPRLAALEQPAMLEEHVHELPEHVVERLHELLAHRRVVARRSEHPLRAGSREADRQAAAGAGQRGGGRQLLGAAEADRDVGRLGDELQLAPSAVASAPTPSAGSARLPTITGCTNSTATWRTSRRAPGELP